MNIFTRIFVALSTVALIGVGLTAGPLREAVSSEPVIIAAVGDMACDPDNPKYAGGQGTSIACKQSPTSTSLLQDTSVTNVLGLGDYQYDCGDVADWAASYTPTWGRLNSLMNPAAGNHEYKTGADAFGDQCPASNSLAQTYFNYFGVSAHQDTAGHYSFDVGSWHIIGLNANCSRTNVGGCTATSAQTTWLKNDLFAHPAVCTLAYWHQPRFQGLATNVVAAYKPWWDVLAANHVDVVLNGHIHNYQRFPELNSAGSPDSNGIVEYVVGTGGEAQVAMKAKTSPLPTYWRKDFGYLKLTLSDNGWSSVFVNNSGTRFDPFTGVCNP